MAKKIENQVEGTSDQVEGVVGEVVDGAVEIKTPKDNRAIRIKHPKTGEEVKRIDYIRERWSVDRVSRGDIARELTEIQTAAAVAESGDKTKVVNVPYQIVFAATKGIEGGPVETTRKKPAEAASQAPVDENTDSDNSDNTDEANPDLDQVAVY